MKKLFLMLGFILMLGFNVFAWNNSGYDEGDLYMNNNSIRGDATNGIKFDPDNDGTDEITMNPDGTISSTGITISSVTITADTISAEYLIISSTSSFAGLMSGTTAEFTGSIDATTINTGQGDYELYAMDQDVRTTDDVTFASATVTNLLTAGTVDTGQGATEVYLMNQNIQTTDDVTFATVTATVLLDTLGTPTYQSVQDWSDGTQSAGVIDGGVLTDSGAGEIDISTVNGIIKTTNTESGANLFFDLTGAVDQALTDEMTNWVAVDYNSGTPQFVIGTTNIANGHTIFNLGKVFREGTSLDIITSGLHIDDFSKRVQQHHNDEASLHFTSGATLGAVGTKQISITAGVMYSGLNRIITDAIDTSGADTFEYYYYDGDAGPAVWVEVSSTTIDNLQYNNTLSGLATLNNNQYGLHWGYKGTTSTSYVLYGQDSYTLIEAQRAQPPASLPDHVEEFGVLRAKIIIEKSDTVFTEIEGVDDTQFTAQTASNHNELQNLDGGTAAEYYHLTNSAYGNLSAQDQAVLTTSNVTFATMTVSNYVDAAEYKIDALNALAITANNTFVGETAASSGTTSCTLLGKDAGDNLTTGSANIAIGYLSGSSLTTESDNCFIGNGAGSSTTDDDNTMIGVRAGISNSTGSANVFLGNEAGNSSAGSANVFIGYRSGYNELGDNKLYLENSNSASPLIYGEFDNNIVIVNGDLSSTGTIASTDILVSSTSLNSLLGTGVIEGGEITINADTTKFDVAAGSGILMDKTDRNNPTLTRISWTDQTAVTTPFLNTKAGTWIVVDVNGDIVPREIDLSPDELSSFIRLGRLGHFGKTVITNTFNFPLYYDVENDYAAEIMQYGTTNLSGNTVFANGGGNLKLDKGEGWFSRIGANANTSKNDPNQVFSAAISSITFRRAYRDGTGGTTLTTEVTDIDPDFYDDGDGTLAAVPSNDYQILDLIMFPYNNSLTIFLLYGQETYANFDMAKSALITYSPVINSDILGSNTRARIIVKESLGDLSAAIIAGNAAITAGALFGNITSGASGGGGGGGGVSLQSAYNVSSPPQIVTDDTKEALQIKNNSLNHNAFEIISPTDVVVATISGTGKITANDVISSSATITNLLTCGTINTGQGVTEVYAMDQDVLTTSDVVFTTSTVGNTGDESTLTIQGTSAKLNMDITGATDISLRSNNFGGNAEVGFYHDNFADYSLFINRLGNVGVSTGTPNYKLDVNGSFHSTSASIDESLSVFSAANNAGISIVGDDVSNQLRLNYFNPAGVYNWSIYKTSGTTTNNSDLVFAGGIGTANITSVPERMRINEDGEVGIGTNDPTTLLHVCEPSSDVLITLETKTDADCQLRLVHDNTVVGRIGYDFSGKQIEISAGAFNNNDITISTTTNNVGINKSDASETLHVGGTVMIDDLTGTGGSAVFTNGGKLGIESSTIRSKYEVRDYIQNSNKIFALRPVTFKYKSNDDKGFGLIAEEVYKLFPRLVFRNKDGEIQGIHYEKLAVCMIGTLKDMNKRIKELERNAVSFDTCKKMLKKMEKLDKKLKKRK